MDAFRSSLEGKKVVGGKKFGIVVGDALDKLADRILHFIHKPETAIAIDWEALKDIERIGFLLEDAAV